MMYFGIALPFLMLMTYATIKGSGSQLKGVNGMERRQHQIQHGHCTYTFLLPELDNCQPSVRSRMPNSLQRDAPPASDNTQSDKRLQQLEHIMENNTLWLHKLENYIEENVKTEISEIKRNAVQNQTAAMTSILTQKTEQTCNLTYVENQVLNQTSRLETQLLENSLSTNNLEKQLLVQVQEISKLNSKNSFLEKKILEMEGKHEKELQVIKEEKLQMHEMMVSQSDIIAELDKQLKASMFNNTVLQMQQVSLERTVQELISLVSQCNEISVTPKGEPVTFKDCAEVYKSGHITSAVYTLNYPNSTETVKAFCDMETNGGAWTVIQHRKDGTVDFRKTWREYKTGFGNPANEYWLGNEFIHQITTSNSYIMRVQLQDWEGNSAFAQYSHFHLGSEKQNYRLHISGYSGTAGRMSSFSPSGTEFSTVDADNDKCSGGCKCAQMATGGWWFDACGPSNLNGIYYPGGTNTVKYNGIKWHYWKGPSHGVKTTTMMIRPTDF
ncbi:angiopoietin-2-like [Protopterus annectens]|uniref:angiopoietin-2-like n=1 Tax=Protopterus annectens TaxID=7888 RepID=UPI001CF9A5EE|nr:angiopoietin-2-like [Protopterus annectens]